MTPVENNLQNDNEKKTDDEGKDFQTKEENIEKLSSEEEIEQLKDKLARTFAEMENQRRRYEKEKEDDGKRGSAAGKRGGHPARPADLPSIIRDLTMVNAWSPPPWVPQLCVDQDLTRW